MADTQTTKTTGALEVAFVDGDTRTVTIPNLKVPQSVESAMSNLNDFLRTNNFLVGDQDNATFAQINKLTRKGVTTTILDINES